MYRDFKPNAFCSTFAFKSKKYTELHPNEAEGFIYLLWIYAEQKQKDKVQELLLICNQKDSDWQKRREYQEIVMSLSAAE